MQRVQSGKKKYSHSLVVSALTLSSASWIFSSHKFFTTALCNWLLQKEISFFSKLKKETRCTHMYIHDDGEKGELFSCHALFQALSPENQHFPSLFKLSHLNSHTEPSPIAFRFMYWNCVLLFLLLFVWYFEGVFNFFSFSIRAHENFLLSEKNKNFLSLRFDDFNGKYFLRKLLKNWN